MDLKLLLRKPVQCFRQPPRLVPPDFARQKPAPSDLGIGGALPQISPGEGRQGQGTLELARTSGVPPSKDEHGDNVREAHAQPLGDQVEDH